MSKKLVKTVVTILVVSLIAFKAVSILKDRKAQIANQKTPLMQELTISLEKPKIGELSQKENVLGTLLAKNSTQISTRLSAYIDKVFVNESDMVKKGDLLAKIDTTSIKTAIRSQQSLYQAKKKDLETTKMIYQRNKKLYKIGGISKQSLELSLVAVEQKYSALEAIKQKIDSLKNDLNYLDIKAPFDGIVDRVILREGDLAVPGKPILSISSYDKKLIFNFSSDKIKKGDKVFYNKKEIGYVKSIYNIAKNSLSTAEVALTSSLKVPINSTLNIEIQTDKKRGCLISNNSILYKSDGEYIILYKDHRFVPKKIDIVLQSKNNSIIKSCPKYPIAKASQSKLMSLGVYKNIKVTGNSDE